MNFCTTAEKHLLWLFQITPPALCHWVNIALKAALWALDYELIVSYPYSGDGNKINSSLR